MATKAANDQTKSNLTPETYLEGYRMVRDSAKRLSEAQAVHRNALKRAKGMGIDLPALKEAMALAKQDRDEVEMHQRKVAQYAAWLGMPLGSQASLFDPADGDMPSDKAQAEKREMDAEDAGYAAGRAGRDRHDHAYPTGTPMHAAFDRGWIEGQTFIANGLGGETPKRGRKKRGGNAEDGPVMDAAA